MMGVSSRIAGRYVRGMLLRVFKAISQCKTLCQGTFTVLKQDLTTASTASSAVKDPKSSTSAPEALEQKQGIAPPSRVGSSVHTLYGGDGGGGPSGQIRW